MIELALSLAASAAPLQVHAETFTLDNGLTVILEENHRADSVALFLHYGVGSRDEHQGEHGCAHLFEHIMFEGSAHVPGSSFDDWLTAAGGNNNAYTSEDQTAYHMEFPAGALDLALFLESDRMAFLDAGLTAENVQNQQSVVLQERARGYDGPNGRDWDALALAQFPPEHPYGHPVIGSEADVSGFSLDAVQDFWRRSYRPSNAVLVLVGHFETADAREAVTRWFSDVPDHEAAPRSERADFAFTPQRHMLYDNVSDRSLYLSWGTVPEAHVDHAALEIAAQALSGGRGARLSDALVYDHSVADYELAMDYPMRDEGLFLVMASTSSRSLRAVNRVAQRQVASLWRDPLSDDELDRARRVIRASRLDAQEAPLDRASELARCQVTYGTPDCLVGEWQALEAVTAADVARVAQTYLTQDRLTALSVVPNDDRRALPHSTLVEVP